MPLARRTLSGVLAVAAAAVGLAATGHSPVVTATASGTFDTTLYDLVNQVRVEHGVAPLRWNPQLATVAEGGPQPCAATVGGRADDMIARGYFSHTIPGCSQSNVFGMLSSLGIGYSTAGENVGWESGVTDPAQAAQTLNSAYVNSPEHLANMLNPAFTDIGVGSASTAPGQAWSFNGVQNATMSAEVFAGGVRAPLAQAVALPPSPTGGYWIAGADGSVYDFGAPGNYGSMRGRALSRPVVGMATTPDHGGYWLVGSDGGVFPFGDATGYGSTGGIHLNQPVVGMAATSSGRGYWLVASDGGVFPFGDAVLHSYGSTGGRHLNQPIVGMASTPDGNGYWLVARDGGVFPFGDAIGYGSTGGIRLNQPIVGMASSRAGNGYWLVASDGGLFPFGDARFHSYGSAGNVRLARPIVGMAAAKDGNGYWLVAADGGIFPFGDAPGLGSTGGNSIPASIVGVTIG